MTILGVDIGKDLEDVLGTAGGLWLEQKGQELLQKYGSATQETATTIGNTLGSITSPISTQVGRVFSQEVGKYLILLAGVFLVIYLIARR